MEELVVVVEELARNLCPGPFVPTVIASALIARAGNAATRASLLPGLASGEVVAAAALHADCSVSDGRATGSAEVVLGAGLADIFVVPVGDDAMVLQRSDVEVETPVSLDPTRRSARVRFADAPALVLPSARRALLDLARTILASDAVGVAGACTSAAAGDAQGACSLAVSSARTKL